ncbi:MAG: hypothetical protein AAF035_01290 [Pseudomonadota bacterium]
MSVDKKRADDWEDYYARQKRISERNMIAFEAKRPWHDWAAALIAGFAAAFLMIALDWLLN